MLGSNLQIYRISSTKNIFDYYDSHLIDAFGNILSRPTIINLDKKNQEILYEANGADDEDRLIYAKKISQFQKLPIKEKTFFFTAIDKLKENTIGDKQSEELSLIYEYFSNTNKDKIGDYYLSNEIGDQSCRLILTNWGTIDKSSRYNQILGNPNPYIVKNSYVTNVEKSYFQKFIAPLLLLLLLLLIFIGIFNYFFHQPHRRNLSINQGDRIDQSGKQSGSQAESQPSSQPGSQDGAKPSSQGSQTGKQPGPQAESQPGSQPGSQDGAKPGSQGSQTGKQPGPQAESQPGSQPGSQDGAKPSSQGSQTGKQPGPQAESQPGSQPGSQDGNQIGDQSGSQKSIDKQKTDFQPDVIITKQFSDDRFQLTPPITWIWRPILNDQIKNIKFHDLITSGQPPVIREINKKTIIEYEVILRDAHNNEVKLQKKIPITYP